MQGEGSSSPLSTALDYLKRGWSIVPQLPGAKHPCIRWKRYQDRLPTEAEVRTWWTRWPDAGFALVIGPASGLFVIDVDGTAAHEALVKHLGSVPDAPMAISGSHKPDRYHLFFKHPDGLKTKATATPWHPQLEFRGQRGIVILAPSMHKSGHRYEWAAGAAPRPEDLPEVPALVRAALTAAVAPLVHVQPSHRASNLLGVDHSEKARQAAQWLQGRAGGVKGHGGRSGPTYAAACALVVGYDMVAHEAYRLLAGWNAQVNSPPYSEAELRHKLDDADKAEDHRGRGWRVYCNRDFDTSSVAQDTAIGDGGGFHVQVWPKGPCRDIEGRPRNPYPHGRCPTPSRITALDKTRPGTTAVLTVPCGKRSCPVCHQNWEFDYLWRSQWDLKHHYGPLYLARIDRGQRVPGPLNDQGEPTTVRVGDGWPAGLKYMKRRGKATGVQVDYAVYSTGAGGDEVLVISTVPPCQGAEQISQAEALKIAEGAITNCPADAPAPRGSRGADRKASWLAPDEKTTEGRYTAIMQGSCIESIQTMATNPEIFMAASRAGKQATVVGPGVIEVSGFVDVDGKTDVEAIVAFWCAVEEYIRTPIDEERLKQQRAAGEVPQAVAV